jgi:hypothetical protein
MMGMGRAMLRWGRGVELDVIQRFLHSIASIRRMINMTYGNTTVLSHVCRSLMRMAHAGVENCMSHLMHISLH